MPNNPEIQTPFTHKLAVAEEFDFHTATRMQEVSKNFGQVEVSVFDLKLIANENSRKSIISTAHGKHARSKTRTYRRPLTARILNKPHHEHLFVVATSTDVDEEGFSRAFRLGVMEGVFQKGVEDWRLKQDKIKEVANYGPIMRTLGKLGLAGRIPDVPDLRNPYYDPRGPVSY